MHISAIITMIIGCGVLWGGCIAASLYNYRCSKRAKLAQTAEAGKQEGSE